MERKEAIYSRIGRNIRSALRERGVRQKDLAGKIDKSPALVSYYLSGQVRIPVDSLVRIAVALEVKPSLFLDVPEAVTV